MEFAHIPINELQIIPNTRRPDELLVEKSEFRELVESIAKFGLLHPIAVTKHGDNYQVICGVRRLAALRFLGIRLIPCTIHPEESGIMCNALSFHENRIRTNPHWSVGVAQIRAQRKAAHAAASLTALAEIFYGHTARTHRMVSRALEVGTMIDTGVLVPTDYATQRDAETAAVNMRKDMKDF